MNAVMFFTALLFLLFFTYGPWQRHCEDWARQRLFEIRAELFDFAADRNLRFSDPSYIYLRDLINDLIRFTHEIKFSRLISILLFYNKKGNFSKDMIGSSYGIDDLDYIDSLEQKAARVVLKLILLRSPFLAATAYALRSFLKLNGGLQQITKRTLERYSLGLVKQEMQIAARAPESARARW